MRNPQKQLLYIILIIHTNDWQLSGNEGDWLDLTVIFQSWEISSRVCEFFFCLSWDIWKIFLVPQAWRDIESEIIIKNLFKISISISISLGIRIKICLFSLILFNNWHIVCVLLYCAFYTAQWKVFWEVFGSNCL